MEAEKPATTLPPPAAAERRRPVRQAGLGVGDDGQDRGAQLLQRGPAAFVEPGEVLVDLLRRHVVRFAQPPAASVRHGAADAVVDRLRPTIDVLVAPARAVADDGREPGDEAGDVCRTRPDTDARPQQATTGPVPSPPWRRSMPTWAQNPPSRSPTPCSALSAAATSAASCAATSKATMPTSSPAVEIVVEEPVHGQPVDRRQTVAELGGEPLLVVADDVEARRRELVERRRHGDRTDDVGGAGLVAGRTVEPFDVAAADPAHGATAIEVRRRPIEPVAPADEGAGSERGVQLVPGERDVVGAEPLEVEAAMRRELGGVDDDAGAVLVRRGDDRRQRHQLPRHVARARDGDEIDVGMRQRRPHHGDELLA